MVINSFDALVVCYTDLHLFLNLNIMQQQWNLLVSINFKKQERDYRPDRMLRHTKSKVILMGHSVHSINFSKT